MNCLPTSITPAKEMERCRSRNPTLLLRADYTGGRQTPGPSIQRLASDQVLKVREASQLFLLIYVAKWGIPNRKWELKQKDCMRNIKVVSSYVMLMWCGSRKSEQLKSASGSSSTRVDSPPVGEKAGEPHC